MILFNIATHTRNIVVPLCATMCPDITTNFDGKQTLDQRYLILKGLKNGEKSRNLSRYFWLGDRLEKRLILLRFGEIFGGGKERAESFVIPLGIKVSLHPSLLCNLPHVMVRPIISQLRHKRTTFQRETFIHCLYEEGLICLHFSYFLATFSEKYLTAHKSMVHMLQTYPFFLESPDT